MHDRGRTVSLRLALRRSAVLGGALLLGLVAVELLFRAGVLRLPGPPVHPPFVRHDPWLGWSNRPNTRYRHTTDDFDVTVSVNARGFRGAPWPGPRDGRPRVLVLGDSQIFGWGVEDHECATARLAESAPGWDVLNAGVIGYGTDQEFLLLRQRLQEIRPDVVVVVFTGNDPIEMLSKTAYGRAKPWLERRGSGFEVRGTPLREGWLQRHSRAWRAYLCWKSHRSARSIRIDPASALESTCDVLRAMQRLARVPLVILSLEDALAEFAEQSADISHIHLEPVLRPLGREYRFPGDPHWTPAAHAAVAEALHDALGRVLR